MLGFHKRGRRIVDLSAEAMMDLGVPNSGKDILSGDISLTNDKRYALGHTRREWGDGHVISTEGRVLANDEVPGVLKTLRLNRKLQPIKS